MSTPILTAMKFTTEGPRYPSLTNQLTKKKEQNNSNDETNQIRIYNKYINRNTIMIEQPSEKH